ncbi:unnamed protein product [Arctogadus glacialis]
MYLGDASPFCGIHVFLYSVLRYKCGLLTSTLLLPGTEKTSHSEATTVAINWTDSLAIDHLQVNFAGQRYHSRTMSSVAVLTPESFAEHRSGLKDQELTGCVPEDEAYIPTYLEAFPPLPEKSAAEAKAGEPSGAWGSKIKPIKASVITQVFHVPLEERRYRDNGQFGEGEEAKVCLDIMQRTGAHIELSLAKDQGLSLMVTGKLDSVMKARKEIVARLQTQASATVAIPKELHRFVIGKNGEKLQELELRTATKIAIPRHDDPSTSIRITGTKEGIEKARHEVLLIHAEQDLEDRMEQNLVFTDICDIIHYHAQHNFPVYIDYVRNQIYQEKTYTTLMKSNAQFAEVISRLQESPLCQRLPFMSFLLLPFQRITRIKMLIENILKRTKEQTKEEQTASKALDSVSKIIEECNTEVGKMKQVEELIALSKMLEFDKLKALPIISQNRNLEKKGELGEMSKGATIFNMRAKFSPVHLFLFNDLLILASKKGPERFVVLDYAHRSLVQVEPVVEGPTGPALYENCFTLTLLENHQGRLMERLLKAPSQSDLHRWVVAFPNPSNPERDVEEVIYEDWDCPQVQCVEQYVAGQTDELSLEPTEIINVLRKTNEGWYEGSRLSDGQKGWFPVSSVAEITNEHVRRRNLRERYRVMQAASQVANLAAAVGKAKTGP